MKLKLYVNTYLHSEHFVQLRHIRKHKIKKGVVYLTEKGGETVLAITKTDKVGIPRIYNSTCNPIDNYNRRMGFIRCVQKFIWDCVGPEQVIIEFGFNPDGKEIVCSTEPFAEENSKRMFESGLKDIILYGNVL